MKRSSPNIIHLSPWEELVGEYRETLLDEHFLYVTIEDTTVAFSKGSYEARLVRQYLKNVSKGSKISIIQTDLRKKPILIRLVSRIRTNR